MKWIFAFVLLTSCATFSMTEQAARAGYFMAVHCFGGYPGIPFDSIKRKIIKGRFVVVESLQVYPLMGFADLKHNTIMIAELHRHEPKLYAHEYAHVFGRVSGHPNHIFERCGIE
jgi:hypothetical protein